MEYHDPLNPAGHPLGANPKTSPQTGPHGYREPGNSRGILIALGVIAVATAILLGIANFSSTPADEPGLASTQTAPGEANRVTQ
ncbi:MAG: hypothetical protein KDJ80_09470 [Nitratireductor sp.]|nr:hypothetical protein [Nitratireductor sp.]